MHVFVGPPDFQMPILTQSAGDGRNDVDDLSGDFEVNIWGWRMEVTTPWPKQLVHNSKLLTSRRTIVFWYNHRIAWGSLKPMRGLTDMRWAQAAKQGLVVAFMLESARTFDVAPMLAEDGCS